MVLKEVTLQVKYEGFGAAKPVSMFAYFLAISRHFWHSSSWQKWHRTRASIKAAACIGSPPVLAKMRSQLLLIPLLLLVHCILLASGGQGQPLRLPNGYIWRSRGAHPKFSGKGDFKLLTRRSQPSKLNWKVGYTRTYKS